jgi:hypothetical protein
MEIIDLRCAECGAEIASKCQDENLLAKSLGVLQEDGVYAFFLFLNWKDTEGQVSKLAFQLLKEEFALGSLLGAQKDRLKAIRANLAPELDHLLFAKELLERAMVYARYHAKSSGE